MMRSLVFAIAVLAGVIVLGALGLAAGAKPAVGNASDTWDGAMVLLTGGVLLLAVAGAACRAGGARAWWLGFALFGWGYFALVFSSPYEVVSHLPTSMILKAVMPTLIEPGVAAGMGGTGPIGVGGPLGGMVPIGGPPAAFARWRIGQCLWSLLAAILGGTLALLLFFGPAHSRPAPVAADAPGAARVGRRWWRRPVLLGLAGLVLLASFTLIGLRIAPGLWAGGTYLLTWQLLGLAALGAVYDQGKRRAAWFGAALFGAGTMILILGPGLDQQLAPRTAANHLLNALRVRLPAVLADIPAESKTIAASNARIRAALDQPVPMQFPNETPLEDVLGYIRQATASPEGIPIPIYVNPVGLNEAEKTMTSPVTLDLQGAALGTTLRLVLQQLGLIYHVREGVVFITSESSEDQPPPDADPFLLAGNCWLALLAAGLGGVLAPVVAGRAESAQRPRSDATVRSEIGGPPCPPGTGS